MIKIFHEAPKSMFRDVQFMTDGDYALVNLFDNDPEYYKLFEDAVKQGREVILDNGVFELGTAWDPDKFAYWVRKLQPTYYIVPDVLEDAEATIESFNKFLDKYPGLPGKIMGVAQGKDFQEFKRCYNAIADRCDKICISFDYSWFQNPAWPNRCLNAMHGRQHLITAMEASTWLRRTKPHHLLGIMLPQEIGYYARGQMDGLFGWLDSIDTSNPVVHGLKGYSYGAFGLLGKDSQKLYTLINAEVSNKQYKDILYNISQFRRFSNGVV